MNKEQEIQDELEKYWGQLDRIERMLKWVIIDSMMVDEESLILSDKGHKLKKQLPDISDILEEK